MFSIAIKSMIIEYSMPNLLWNISSIILVFRDQSHYDEFFIERKTLKMTTFLIFLLFENKQLNCETETGWSLVSVIGTWLKSIVRLLVWSVLNCETKTDWSLV